MEGVQRLGTDATRLFPCMSGGVCGLFPCKIGIDTLDMCSVIMNAYRETKHSYETKQQIYIT